MKITMFAAKPEEDGGRRLIFLGGGEWAALILESRTTANKTTEYQTTSSGKLDGFKPSSLLACLASSLLACLAISWDAHGDVPREMDGHN